MHLFVLRLKDDLRLNEKKILGERKSKFCKAKREVV